MTHFILTYENLARALATKLILLLLYSGQIISVCLDYFLVKCTAVSYPSVCFLSQIMMWMVKPWPHRDYGYVLV